jgi:O-methyltransferase
VDEFLVGQHCSEGPLRGGPLERGVTMKWALKSAKNVVFCTPFAKYFFPRHSYCFTTIQLIGLAEILESTRDVPGTVAEIGCFKGETTLWLNQYMRDARIEKPYIAMDTFAGFTSDDIGVEVETRKKSRCFFDSFNVNDQRWFDATMRWNGITGVRSIRADVNDFDLTALAPLSFVLLDVDLYRPIRKALPQLFGSLNRGGVLVVDDCSCGDVRWDGADQAYKEFMQSIRREPEIVLGKLGIVRK